MSEFGPEYHLKVSDAARAAADAELAAHHDWVFRHGRSYTKGAHTQSAIDCATAAQAEQIAAQFAELNAISKALGTTEGHSSVEHIAALQSYNTKQAEKIASLEKLWAETSEQRDELTKELGRLSSTSFHDELEQLRQERDELRGIVQVVADLDVWSPEGYHQLKKAIPKAKAALNPTSKDQP